MKSGAVVADLVDEGSPGERAGVQAGDVLVGLGELRAGTASLFDLKRALCQGGRLACIVRRGGREHRLDLDLP
jgi:S1-C subfamily serine protease